MYCTKCGAEVQEGTKFCNKCGAKLYNAADADKEDGEKMAHTSPAENANRDEQSGAGGKKKKGGVFSSKTQTCKRCGKTFESRKAVDFCPQCENLLKRREKDVEGYIFVAKDVYDEDHSGDEAYYDEVIAHRDAILEKHKVPAEFPNSTQLEAKIKNYQSLSKQEALFIMSTLTQYGLHSLGMDAIGHNLILPDLYYGTVAEMIDVFAVGFHQLGYDRKNGTEIVLYLLLTNDPYLPAFPMVTSLKVGSLQMKSRSGRKVYETFFTLICPNLAYPISRLKELKNLILESGTVRGNMSPDIAAKCINNAIKGNGMYSQCYGMAKIMEGFDFLSEDMEEFMNRHRLLSYDKVHEMMCGGNRRMRNFWTDMSLELSTEENGIEDAFEIFCDL